MWRTGEWKKAEGGEIPQSRTWKSAPSTPLKTPEKQKPTRPDSFHSLHKVPSGDSPYVRAKHVQLVDKDPNKAISLFWAAINSGDRVNSALKDMAIVMKQVDRAEEAVEAIKSFRHLCSPDAQESLDNVLLDLYKRCGRTDDQIVLLEHKLKLLEGGLAFGGRRTKIARSKGKKFHVSIDQEKARLLGNLAWAYAQQDEYHKAEALYREALSIEPDKNKECNLAVCLMKTGRVSEAKSLLERIQPSIPEEHGLESYMKSYERACEMLADFESLMKDATTSPIQIQTTEFLNSSGPLARNQNHGPQEEKKLKEAGIPRSSSISALKSILSCMCLVEESQNHNAEIEELIKTEIQNSSSNSAINGILNSPDSANGIQNHGNKFFRTGNRLSDGNYGEETRSGDHVIGNLRWESDGDKEMPLSPPPRSGHWDSYISSNQGSGGPGNGEFMWGNGSDEQPLDSDESLNGYKISDHFNQASKLENEIREEAFADENLYSNLPNDVHATTWIADGSLAPVRGNWKGPSQASKTIQSQSSITRDPSRRADALVVPFKGDSKQPFQELVTPSSSDRDWRRDGCPVQGNISYVSQELPTTHSQSSISRDWRTGSHPSDSIQKNSELTAKEQMSHFSKPLRHGSIRSRSLRVPAQGNSELLPYKPMTRHSQQPSINGEPRILDIPCNSSGRRWATNAVEKPAVYATEKQADISDKWAVYAMEKPAVYAAEKQADISGKLASYAMEKKAGTAHTSSHGRPSQPIVFGNLQAAASFQNPSASSTNGNSNHRLQISAISTSNEKRAVEVGNLNPSALTPVGNLQSQKLIGGSPGSADGIVNHTYDVSVIGSRRWADMVEEDEALANSCANEKQISPISQWCESWNSRDTFPDENLNTNIMRCASPCLPRSPLTLKRQQEHRQLPKDSIKSLQQKIESINLNEEGSKTPPYLKPNAENDASSDQRKSLFSTGSQWKPLARRSLSFEPPQKCNPAAENSPTSQKVFEIDDYCCYSQAIGSGSKRRGNRLQVFQEMTLPDSPKT